MMIDEELPELKTYHYKLRAIYEMKISVKAPDKYTAEEIIKKGKFPFRQEDLIEASIVKEDK